MAETKTGVGEEGGGKGGKSSGEIAHHWRKRNMEQEVEESSVKDEQRVSFSTTICISSHVSCHVKRATVLLHCITGAFKMPQFYGEFASNCDDPP